MLHRHDVTQRVVWTESFAREAGGAAPLETVRVDLDGRPVAVLPLWIAVHQPLDGGPARSDNFLCLKLFERKCPYTLPASFLEPALSVLTRGRLPACIK